LSPARIARAPAADAVVVRVAAVLGLVCGLEDYWILNLVDRVLEVYREPVADAASAFGWRYRSRQTLAADASIAPIAAPHAAIRVADLLP
jgi:hypothetical protein